MSTQAVCLTAGGGATVGGVGSAVLPPAAAGALSALGRDSNDSPCDGRCPQLTSSGAASRKSRSADRANLRPNTRTACHDACRRTPSLALCCIVRLCAQNLGDENGHFIFPLPHRGAVFRRDLELLGSRL